MVGGAARSWRSCCVALALRASDPNVGWIEVRSPHFLVFSNAGEREARRIADQLSRFAGSFMRRLRILRVDPAQPVLILAAKNENTMKMLLFRGLGGERTRSSRGSVSARGGQALCDFAGGLFRGESVSRGCTTNIRTQCCT